MNAKQRAIRRKRNLILIQQKRRANIRAGLTAMGTPRVNKRHPELRGLDPRTYIRRYMRKQRKQDREGWIKT